MGAHRNAHSHLVVLWGSRRGEDWEVWPQQGGVGEGTLSLAGIRLLSVSDRHKCAATLFLGASEIHPLFPISLHVSHADERFA